jgi:hypothetical protein
MRYVAIFSIMMSLTACTDSEVRYINLDPSVQFDVTPEFIRSVAISDNDVRITFKNTMRINIEIRDGQFKECIVDSVTLHIGEGFGIQGVGTDKYIYIGQYNGSYILKQYSSRANKTFIWINKILP